MTQNLRRASVMLGLAVAIAIPDPSLAQRSPSVRRGAPGAVVPMTDVSITLGSTTTTGRVDAKCGVDEKAKQANTRAYFVLMYPWFGQRVTPDKPQWRFNLEIRRGTTSEGSNQFTFSFLDGNREATIQTVADAERIGSGAVRVMRQGNGARFEVEGRTKQGVPVRATIVCSAFQRGEAAGG
jgi:hypothetical protein